MFGEVPSIIKNKENKRKIYERQLKNHNKDLFFIIDSSNFLVKDKKLLKDKLTQFANSSIEKVKLNNQYCSYAHEVKSFEFLKRFGKLTKSSDAHAKTGPDYKLKGYNIECVCSSSNGTRIEDYRTNETKKSITNDYNEVKSFIYPRFTGSLIGKSEKFTEYLEKNVIDSDEPNIIFLSMGDLAVDYIDSNYGLDCLDFLLEKGPLTFDFKGGKVVGAYYSQVAHIVGTKSKDGIDKNVIIDNDFFNLDKNNHISGVIISMAHIFEKYDESNTILFINPYAINKIEPRDFIDMVYWESDGNNNYIPKKNGVSIWDEIVNNMKFF